jgi:cytidylate kinase
LLIAIDGPAGAGKSTVAQALARTLGFTYLDTGAMYRCVALATLERGEEALLQAPEELTRLAGSLSIELVNEDCDPGGTTDRDGRGRVLLDGRDVTREIRDPAVSEAASCVAAVAGVRDAMVAKQRQITGHGDWVAEGRDIGTVVAPGAELKVFLTASAEERARRRAAQLGVDYQTVLAEQTIRDERDATREHSPLQAAADAVSLDTTGLSLEQVVAQIVTLARRLEGAS